MLGVEVVLRATRFGSDSASLCNACMPDWYPSKEFGIVYRIAYK
jgi:hypothetical protein